MAEPSGKRQSAGLSPKQRKFVAEYLKDGNGTQAAIRAGYSPNTAGVQASDLLTKPNVRAAIGGRLEKVEISAERVLQEIKAIAYADPDANKPEEEMDHGPLGGWLERRRGSSLRFEHKIKALELLGKHLKLFTEKVEHTFGDMTDEQLQARYLALTKGKP